MAEPGTPEQLRRIERKHAKHQDALEKIVRRDHVQENTDIYTDIETGNITLSEAKIRHEKLLLKVASLDHMTGLDNARSANMKTADLIDYCEKNRIPLLGIYFDGDNFKAINTKMGHDKGDIVIKILGKALQKASRRTDLQVRFREEVEEKEGEKTESRLGGDEFFIALPGATLQEAVVIFKRLNSILEILTKDELPEYIGLFNGPITVSAGIAQFNQDTDNNAEGFIKRCERALNHGKGQQKGLLTVSRGETFTSISAHK
jgi:GGDEF domain-containing protein